MKNFLLDGFLRAEDILEEYVRNNEILKEVSGVGLFIYNSDYSDISYKIGNCCLEWDKEIDIFELHKNKYLLHKNNTEIRNIIFNKMDKSAEGAYILSVKNPITELDIYVSSMILKYENMPSLEYFSKNFNFNYFEHFQFHMQTVANNYEKLFYIVDVFTDMLAKRDKYMPYHMSNVALWCNKISEKLEVSEREHILIYVAALLHDIGKLFVPEEIINKPAGLTEKEFAVIKEHPEKSEAILSAILYGMTFFNGLPNIVRHHHEHFNGEGYPDSLAGDEIPYLSRILTVADSIDAMLSRRAYKEPMSVPQIIRELSKKSGIHYDPIVANAAIEVIEEAKTFIDINAMNHVNFISNASLSFFVRNYEKLETVSGNLMLKNKEAMFIFDQEKYFNEEIELNDIYKPTIGFFGSNDFYEFGCEISKKNQNSFEVCNLNFIPTDIYFSIYLLKDIQLISGKTVLDVELIKLGGDTSVVRFKNIDGMELEKQLDHTVVIKFDEEIANETNLEYINCRLIKLFNSGNDYTGIFKYIEISSTQRDSILRFLFRKQLEHRKQIKNAK